MNCERVNQILFLFFDNELEDELLTPFRRHTNGCPDCARRLDYTRKLLFIVRQCCHRQQAPERLRLRILASMPHRRFSEPLH